MHKAASIVAITLAAVASVLVVAGVAQTTAPAPANDKNVVLRGVSTVPVTFDGHVSKFEYGDAARTSFPNGHGTVDVRLKCFDGCLYAAFQIPDLSPFPGDDIVIMLDTDSKSSSAPGKNDIRAYVRRKMENSRQHRGDGKKWVNDYGAWEYRSALYATGWEVEARIPLKSLGVEPGGKALRSLAFRIWDNKPQKLWNWPVGSHENKPDSWGTLVFQPAD